MTGRDADHRYNPLDRETFEAIASNAIGRGSEVNTLPAYRLTHSVGLSGWSVGMMQWDFGQPGRQGKAVDLLSGYQQWAPNDRRFTPEQVESLRTRLQTPGQQGNALTNDERARLNDFLRSDDGRSFVDSLDREQLAYKWRNVGKQLSEIPWLKELSANDPAQAAEIVAMTAKRFNQGEKRGLELVEHLKDSEEITSPDLSDWIDRVSARPPANHAALITGRDNALAAVRVVSALELGDGRLAQAWREQIHESGNITLTKGFNRDPNVQLFDAMMRSPGAASRIIDYIDNGQPPRATVITGNSSSREEMSRVELTRDGALTISSPNGDTFQMTREGWNRNGIPMQGRQPGREADEPDHMEGMGRSRPLTPDHEQHPDHAMLEQIRTHVRGLDQRAGREYDEGSERFSRSLLAASKDNRDMYPDRAGASLASNALERVDHVVIGKDGRYAFAVQGDLHDPAHKRAHVDVVEARQTPVEQSDAKLDAANQQIAQERQLAMQQELHQQLQRTGPVMQA
jgi:hypothetical protein